MLSANFKQLEELLNSTQPDKVEGAKVVLACIKEFLISDSETQMNLAIIYPDAIDFMEIFTQAVIIETLTQTQRMAACN